MPAMSVSLATIVWVPCASDAGAKDQVPAPFANADPSTRVPSVRVTVAPASPDPVSAAFAVILSDADAPVSLDRRSVTIAAAVS